MNVWRFPPRREVTIQVAREVEARDEGTGPIPEEDAEAIKKRILRCAAQTRKNLPEPWRSADLGELL